MTKARDKILLAAQQCFGEAGVAGTNVQQIADCAGVARSSFYRHFRDIDDILLALATQMWTQQLQALCNKCEAIADPIQKWRIFINRMVAMGTQLPESGAMFAENTILHVVRLFYRGQNDTTGKMNRALLPFVEQAKFRNELRNDIDSASITDWLLRQCWSLSSIPPANGWKDEALDHYINAFIFPSLLHPALMTNRAVDATAQLSSEIRRLTEVIARLDARIPKSK